jgi:hypothetical protein
MAQGLVKVLAQAVDGLLEDIELRRPLLTPLALVVEVVVENDIDWLGVRDRDQLVLVGDVLPVVDEQALEQVRDRELDRGSVVERLLLWKR